MHFGRPHYATQDVYPQSQAGGPTGYSRAAEVKAQASLLGRLEAEFCRQGPACSFARKDASAELSISDAIRGDTFWLWFIFSKLAGFVFGFVLGSLFQQVRVFNNFPASLLGSLGFVLSGRCFIINNFSGSFFKKRVFLSLAFRWPK